MINFVQRRLTSESPFVCSFIGHVILQGQADSITGRNVFNCCYQYHVKTDDIMTLAIRHHDIDKFMNKSDDNMSIADWLTELFEWSNGASRLSGSDFDDYGLLTTVNLLCTYWVSA